MNSKPSGSDQVVVQTESRKPSKIAVYRWLRWVALTVVAALFIFGVFQLIHGGSNHTSSGRPTLKNDGYVYTILFDKSAKPAIVAGAKSLSGVWPGTGQKLTFTAAPVSKDTDLSACGVIVRGWKPDFSFSALGSIYHTCSLNGTDYAGVVKSGSQQHLVRVTFASASKNDINQNIAKSIFSSIAIEKS